MIKRKVCMVGDFSVGKTSLTQRFAHNSFSEKYLTTIGVKIDNVIVDNTKLIIWDVAGRDALSPINVNYLTGADGVVMVADGTREESIISLWLLSDLIEEKLGSIPRVVAINKSDDPTWILSNRIQDDLDETSWKVFFTSAKNGNNVPEMFGHLCATMTADN